MRAMPPLAVASLVVWTIATVTLAEEPPGDSTVSRYELRAAAQQMLFDGDLDGAHAAASAALAPVASKTSARCEGLPAPPEAITGTETASVASRSCSRS